MLQAAEEHYRYEQRVAVLGVVAVRRVWDELAVNDLDRSWTRLGPRVVAAVTASQLLAARDADRYVAAALDEQGVAAPAAGTVRPVSFAGHASDGRDLASLLYEPVIDVKQALGGGRSRDEALARGRSSLEMLAATMVQDAGRSAVGAAITARPRVSGYVRMLNPPSCSRCTILAGKHFRWNTGFLRHPRCDCRHVPASENVAGDLRTDPAAAARSGQVTDLTSAERQAVAEGADLAQVVNARRGSRGMTTAEGTSRRGHAGARLQGQRRLTPEGIYRLAGDDRDQALRLLRQHAYLT